MGIVKISDLMHENLRIASNAMSRSINAQAEHWLKMGMLAELYPQLSHHELARALVQAELQGGADIVRIIQSDPHTFNKEENAQ
ncbi:ParD-like family protein [Yersinia enterocolitica]